MEIETVNIFSGIVKNLNNYLVDLKTQMYN